MALFKPEVRTVEGSNVGTYTPPTVDYSNFFAGVGEGIASIIKSKNNGASMTEGDKKAVALRNVTSGIQRTFEIEDPTVRAANMKIMQQKALLEYPMYRDDIKSIFGEFTGEIYTATGVSPEDIQKQNAYKWSTETAEGQAVVAFAMQKAKGNEVLADSIINEEYLKDLLYKQNVEASKEEVATLEADEKKRKLLFEGKVRPALQAKVANAFNIDTSMEFKQTLIRDAQAKGIDETTYLLDALTMTRAQRLAEITNEINRLGLDPTTVNPESFLKDYDAAISAMTLNKDLIARSLQNKTETEKAVAVGAISDPFVREAAIKGNPIFLTEYLTMNPKNKEMIFNIGQASIGAAGNGMIPPVSATNLSDGTVGDSPTSFAKMYEGAAPREELEKIFKATPEAKRSLIKLGFDAINNYKYDQNLPEKTEAAHRNIAGMYIAAFPDIDIEGESIKSTNVRNLLGNRAFDTINAIKSTNPEMGNHLFTVMNTYSANTAKRLIDGFTTNMEIIKDTDFVPFILEMDKNGNISLNVNPDAVRTDTTLKKAMGAYRYETVGGGKAGGVKAVSVAPTETDPMKILSNYTSIKNSMTLSRPFGEGSNKREIMDNIEALKLIAMQSRNIPAEIRNKTFDPIEIIKQNVTVRN